MHLSNLRNVCLRSHAYQLVREAHTKANVAPIKKVLIANRGEIACRVMRTARKMGVKTVAVFSDPDRQAMHVSMADEAHYIGSAAAQESYLRGEKVMKAAKDSGADAIHPGYGFLSESTEFADLCEKEGVVFVGPPASAIRDMGIKSTSKHIMHEAGVPIIGGYHGDDQTEGRLLQEAKNIGFPVMIKAVRGGGGKGMRIAMNEGEFLSQLKSAKTEAMKSFGDEVMLVEKYVERPRHVEVQVFGDQHDNYVYLFERDCSVQRRHQKIIEEAPAPGVTSAIRTRLGEAAVRAARAVHYVGAGTVEFIMDRNFDFYFMEMNTRLQVEHPVTEMITGVDLVEWQLRVAAGEPIPLLQNDLQVKGHSFEGRIYAEDPANDFLPGAGTLHAINTPTHIENVRIETGVSKGDTVSVHYDPMIAKLVVWGKDRLTALSKLHSALAQFNVVGLSTNVDFLMSLSSHPSFASGDVHTDFIPQHKKQLFPHKKPTSKLMCQAALCFILSEDEERVRQSLLSHDSTSPFRSFKPSNACINHHMKRSIMLNHDNQSKTVQVTYLGDGKYKMDVDGNMHHLYGNIERHDGSDMATVNVDDNIEHIRVCIHDNAIHLFTQQGPWQFTQPSPKFLKQTGGGIGGAGGGVAPMPGVVERVCVTVGQEVKTGDPLVVLIAMKMEYVIKATVSGKVEKVLHQPGQNVAKDAQLVKIKAEQEE